MAAIEHPDWREIDGIQPGSGTGQCCPDWVPCLPPHHRASRRCKQSCKWPSQAYARARAQWDIHGIPANVSAESRQKYRHVCGKAAPLHFNEMSHLMHQDEHGKTDAEHHAEESPVDADERPKAQEELEFEDGQQEGLALC